ncbi:MAG: MFS transporter [Saprospiraceae bacterium]|nr:MFS transporter [Saprospiraceae bacterium]
MASIEHPTPASQMNDKRTINAWALFDCANSSYALVISVAIFPAYFISATDDIIHIGNWQLSNSALYAYAISAAYLILAVFSPLLSGIADYGGKKMRFLRFFTVLGSTACISLFFFKGMSDEATQLMNNWQLLLGTGGFMLATIGFAGGLVFYNSYLPEIATEDQYDRVSAKGFSYGYIGSVFLLILNMVVITKPEWFGIREDMLAIRFAFIMVGVWWFGIALIPFRRLPKQKVRLHTDNIIGKGWAELKKVWEIIKHEGNIKKFLFSFFCYSAGVQTVLFLATTFAEKELQLSAVEMIMVVLILQIVAIAGAYLFAYVSTRLGNKKSLMIMLFIWIGICLTAYFVTEKAEFYAVAAAVGLVMGGIQSLSRSTYSKLIPAGSNDNTSFFSFYDILEKGAIVLGTFSFGFIEQITGGMRNSILALTFFFLLGTILLSRVKIQHAKANS